MFRVVIAQPIDDAGTRMLVDAGYDVKQLDDLNKLKEAVANADGLLVRDAHVPAEIIESAPRLKVISRHGAGVERIDLATASRHGIIVTNTPEANSESVAEHTMALILNLAKNIRLTDRALRNNDFDIRHRHYGIELAGKMLGIVGMGKVGKRLARIAYSGFQMNVIAYDPAVTTAIEGVTMRESLRAVCEEADFISLHLPLTAETRGMFGEREFDWMKPGAFFINCARGPIVDEKALVRVLKEKRIAGAGIDVYTSDPPQAGHPFFALDNVILTPHTAAHTHEAMRSMAVHAAQGIIEVLSGKEPAWKVPA